MMPATNAAQIAAADTVDLPAVSVAAGMAHGQVRHRRHLPRPHQLNYAQHMAMLDVDQLPDALIRPGRWQKFRRAGLCFARADYMSGPAHDPQQALGAVVRERVARSTGNRPDGSIILLAHLRQWGYCFNPVSFYFCHHQGSLSAIVAEITNTPWGERHAYVLDVGKSERTAAGYRFSFRKAFHVSPYMPMDIDYRWTFTVRGQHLAILMQLYREQQCVFDVAYGLRIVPWQQTSMQRLAWRYPLQCQRVWWGIYWHALLLKLKKIRFYPHPNRS